MQVIPLQEKKNYYKTEQLLIEHLPIEDFLSMPPVFCQRQVEYRFAAVRKRLKAEHFSTHLQVDVFEYPDGKRVVGNGNTRSAIWASCIRDGDDADIPSHVSAAIHFVENDEAAKKLYYTIDSVDAVEKTPDKITGVFRALGLSFDSKRLAKGQISKSLQYAVENSGAALSTSRMDWFKAVEFYKDELICLDKVGLNKYFNVHVICSFLMMLKRHGTNSPRLIEGITNYKNRFTQSGSPRSGYDGITTIINEENNKKIFDNGFLTDGISFPKQQDFLIYCLEKWMEHANIHYRSPSTKRGSGCRRCAYENFWDSEE